MSRPAPLFVTGPARSGSTLLAHMLNAHPAVAMASDVFFPLFRSLRNAVVRQPCEAFSDWNEASPLEDYYFTDQRIRRLDCVQASSLAELVAADERAALVGAMQDRAAYESPDVAALLTPLNGLTYRDLLADGLARIIEARPRRSDGWAGAKDVWTLEFFGPLAQAFPDARFVILLRDPRAIVASMLAISDQDPTQIAHTLSYARHWRKYVAFWLHYRSIPAFRTRMHLLSYEELVKDPRAQAESLCRFLDLDLDEAMTNVDRFRATSSDKPWQGNSSFQDRLTGISTANSERWRAALATAARKLVEFVCGPEMKAVGYKPDDDYYAADNEVLAYLLENGRQYCKWRTDFQDPQRDFGYELFRHALLGYREPIGADVIRRSFLFEEVYACLKTSCP